MFLDFDGVLHPVHCQTDELFTRVPLLEDVLRAHPTVRVVISSSWREVHALDDLREFFADDIAQRICGATPSLGSMTKREAECRAWLKKHAPDAPWIALDDQPSEFSLDCQQLLAIDGTTGLTAQDAMRLQDRLRVAYESSRQILRRQL